MTTSAMQLFFERDPSSGPCRNRLFEWITAWMLIGIGVTLMLFPASIETTSFRFMLLHIHQTLLWPFFVVFGIGRMLALNANGVWPIWGRRIRASGCLFGATMWAQMAVALAMSAPVSGQLSIGVPVYIALTVGEFVSFRRVLRDARRIL